MSLQSRCQEMLNRIQRDSATIHGASYKDLMAFLLAEKTRMNSPEFAAEMEEVFPLCLFFRNAEERASFVTWMEKAKAAQEQAVVP